MKKFCVVLMLCLGLSGCGTVETFETLGPVQHEPDEAPAMGEIQISLPESASKEVFANNDSSCYECDGYTLMLQTFSSGNLTQTIRNLSGFAPDKLTVLESKNGDYKRYEWVWTAAGEGADVLCRAMVIDDGDYHYCLSVMAPAQNAGALQGEWNQVFTSFTLS